LERENLSAESSRGLIMVTKILQAKDLTSRNNPRIQMDHKSGGLDLCMCYKLLTKKLMEGRKKGEKLTIPHPLQNHEIGLPKRV